MPRIVNLKNYVQGVLIPGRRAKLVAQQLVLSLPEDHGQAERDALDVVVRVAGEVDDVLSLRDRVSATKLKPFRKSFAVHWTAFASLLQALTTVPARLGDRGARASAMMRRVFPSGVTFAHRQAPDAWTEGRRRLDTIVKERLREEIASLVGADVLTAVEEATDELGGAIGVTGERRELPNRNALQTKRLKFSRAVSAYCRVLSVNLDDDDEASADRFLRAVAPIDEHRIGHGARSDEDEVIEDEATDPPLPTE